MFIFKKVERLRHAMRLFGVAGRDQNGMGDEASAVVLHPLAVIPCPYALRELRGRY